MGKRAGKTMGIVGLAIAGLMLMQVSASAAEVTLKVADTFPANHYIMEHMIKPWMDIVKEKSGGRVDFKYFPGGQLGKLSEMLDMVENGVADISYVPPSSYAERLPLTGVIELPGMFKSTVHGSLAFTNFLNDYLVEKEFKTFKVLPIIAGVVPQYQVGANRAPINTVDGFKGIRLRTPGGVLELAANELGAVAIPMAGPETYTAFQRGTVDATLQSFLSMRSYKLYEVMKSVSSNGSFGTFGVTYVINENVFKRLPADIHKIMVDAGHAISESFAKWMDEEEGKVAKEFQAKGLTIYAIPADVAKDWDKRLARVTERWAQREDARGLKGSEAVAMWRKTLEKTQNR
jgi:TRAP-type C4-dicarboxylate transport system substrate-binding protein